MKAATEWTADDTGVTKISIHAAREGGDAFRGKLPKVADISIHAAREGGDHRPEVDPRLFCISIHAAREGGDAFGFVHTCKQLAFQSTPPVKAATTRKACRRDSPSHFNPRRP